VKWDDAGLILGLPGQLRKLGVGRSEYPRKKGFEGFYLVEFGGEVTLGQS